LRTSIFPVNIGGIVISGDVEDDAETALIPFQKSKVVMGDS
jgi:hypothetical protein